MFTLYRITFVPARRPYRIGLRFTHKNGDFRTISVTERNCSAPISKVESDISDRCLYYTGYLFVSARKAAICIACVAWRFCRAGRTRGVAARKRKIVAPAPISSRFFCPRPPLLLSDQNRHATQATICMVYSKYFDQKSGFNLGNSYYFKCIQPLLKTAYLLDFW